MDLKAITIAIESCETDDYTISGAGLLEDEVLKSVSITWNADATAAAPAPLPDRVRVKCISSVLRELQGGIFSATVVVSQHDFNLLVAALDAAPRKLTITEDAVEFSCKKVTISRDATLAVLAKVAAASAKTLEAVQGLGQGMKGVERKLDALLHVLPPKIELPRVTHGVNSVGSDTPTES